MSSNLPSLLGSTTLASTASRRDLARVERAVSREVAEVQGKARVLTERGLANTRALEEVSRDALLSGTAVTQTAVQLASACPAAEPMLRGIVAETGLALGRVVSDLSRDLR